MTTNQIEFAKHKEQSRHNRVTEGETSRHNVATEGIDTARNVETARHNIESERQNWFTTNWQRDVGFGNLRVGMEQARASMAHAAAAQASAAAANRQAGVQEAMLPYLQNEKVASTKYHEEQAKGQGYKNFEEGARNWYAPERAHAEAESARAQAEKDKAWPLLEGMKFATGIGNLLTKFN